MSDYENPSHLIAGTESAKMEYIISTGGTEGQPGFGIYVRGANLGAVVSTGNLTWRLEVGIAMPPPGIWNNLAVRWEPRRFDNATHYAEQLQEGKKPYELGGLQLLLNMEHMGHVLQPTDVYGCEINGTTGAVTCPDEPPAVQQEFEPPEMMLGCTKSRLLAEKHFQGSGLYDEVAVWIHKLNDTEKPYVMGGYRELQLVFVGPVKNGYF